jgi:hypothetical protein
MHLLDLFPSTSKYLNHAALGGKELDATIKQIELATFKNDDGSEQSKPVLYFEETPKQFVLNKTNATVLAMMFGEDTSTWLGGKITLFPTRVDFKGRKVDSVRIKRPAKAAA